MTPADAFKMAQQPIIVFISTCILLPLILASIMGPISDRGIYSNSNNEFSGYEEISKQFKKALGEKPD